MNGLNTSCPPCKEPIRPQADAPAVRPYAAPRLVVHGDATSLTHQVDGRGIDGPIS